MLQPASVGFSTHHFTTDTLEFCIDPIDTPCNDSVYLRLPKQDNNLMTLNLFWLIKRNPDDEQPRIWYQIKDDDVSFPVIPPVTTLVLKLLHNAPRKTWTELFWVGLHGIISVGSSSILISLLYQLCVCMRIKRLSWVCRTTKHLNRLYRNMNYSCFDIFMMNFPLRVESAFYTNRAE